MAPKAVKKSSISGFSHDCENDILELCFMTGGDLFHDVSSDFGNHGGLGVCGSPFPKLEFCERFKWRNCELFGCEEDVYVV
jgi:hypothetical protein